MQTQYFKEYSRYMKREMEFKVYGYTGRPCLVLPAQGHRFYEFEDCGMVDAAARWIEAGQLQLFCADALNGVGITPQAQERWFCYLTEELLPRLRVLLRKPQGGKTTVLRVGELELHLDTRQVFRQGREVRLSSKEFSLLRYMMQNAGIVLSREKLEQHVWDYGYSGGSNVIDVYIRYLRKKLDQGHPVKYIHTVRGAGYVLKEGEG